MLSIEKKIKIYSLIFFISLISCNPSGSTFSPNPDPIIPAQISTGNGMFIYSRNNIDFEVFYYVPENYNASSKIVFVLHGGSRDAESARNNMISKSIEYNLTEIIFGFKLYFSLKKNIIWFNFALPYKNIKYNSF